MREWQEKMASWITFTMWLGKCSVAIKRTMVSPIRQGQSQGEKVFQRSQHWSSSWKEGVDFPSVWETPRCWGSDQRSRMQGLEPECSYAEAKAQGQFKIRSSRSDWATQEGSHFKKPAKQRAAAMEEGQPQSHPVLVERQMAVWTRKMEAFKGHIVACKVTSNLCNPDFLWHIETLLCPVTWR